MGKYKGSIAEVEDANGRRVVKSRTTTAPPTHNANIDVYIVPTGATGEWSTHIGEIALDDGTVWLYKAVPPSGLRIWVGDEDLECVCTNGQFREEIASSFEYDADRLLVTTDSDWEIAVAAGGGTDTNNGSFPVRRFPNGTETGVGVGERSAVGSSKLKLILDLRAETAPAAVRKVGLKLRARELGGTWANVVLNDHDIPADETWTTFTQIVTLSSLSVGDGKLIQFQLTRVAPGGGTDLENDLTLTHLGGSFL